MVEPRFEQFLTRGAPAVVMVSGGGDSVALLRLLVADGRAADVTVYHLNHQLRGEESAADTEFVRDLAAELCVGCVVESVDIAAYAAERNLNLEDAGRRVRYDGADRALDDLCAQCGIDPRRGRVVTAHTRDDRVETFFARAVAGAGTTGLASIPRSRGRIVRPLLDTDRAELRHYLESGGFSWREDESNHDTSRERAYIRHHVVPALEELNPRFRENLARTMDLVVDDDALLQSMASGFARDFSDDSVAGEFVSLNLMFMRSLDQTMARRVVRTAVLQAFPEASRLESAHIQRLVDALASDEFAHDLPGGLRAEVRHGTLRVSRTSRGPRSSFSDTPLEYPGTTDLGEAGEVQVALVSIADALAAAPSDRRPSGAVEWARLASDRHTAVVDAGALLATLTAGPPREGERYKPLGLEGTKKLSDILVDSKVAREERGMVPVVRDGRSVVWVVGQPPSADYRVVETTEHALTIGWTPAQSRRN